MPGSGWIVKVEQIDAESGFLASLGMTKFFLI